MTNPIKKFIPDDKGLTNKEKTLLENIKKESEKEKPKQNKPDYESLIMSINFSENDKFKICENLDQLFYFLSADAAENIPTEAIQEKIESGIMRLKVLKAFYEAEHYEKRLNTKKKKKKIFLIVLLSLAIGLPLLLLLIDYFTGGEFLKPTPIEWPFK